MIACQVGFADRSGYALSHAEEMGIAAACASDIADIARTADLRVPFVPANGSFCQLASSELSIESWAPAHQTEATPTIGFWRSDSFSMPCVAYSMACICTREAGQSRASQIILRALLHPAKADLGGSLLLWASDVAAVLVQRAVAALATVATAARACRSRELAAQRLVN